jgi:hypothetical protein
MAAWFLASAIEAWSVLYSAHPALSTAVRWLHLSALLGGGGAAMVADRRVLAAGRTGRTAALESVRTSHRIVGIGLAVMAASGALMTAADLETYRGSSVYWTKMALLLLLVLNGAVLFRGQRSASREPSGRGWAFVRIASAVSLVLWLLILFVGLWLTQAA